MKRILYIFLLVLLATSCREEDIIESKIQMQNVYTITDDPNDPVNHRRYQIYKKYGVPVYFNDTIGQVLVTTDANGRPYYRYETLDLGWDFNSFNRATYLFDYITDSQRQLELLEAVEYYLGNASKPLWPYAFFITNKITTISQDGKSTVSEITKEYDFNFRVITLVTGNWTPQQPARKVMDNLRKDYVAKKISFYKEDVEEFGKISSDYYDFFYDVLHKKLGTTLEDFGYGLCPTVMNGIDLKAFFGNDPNAGYWDEALNEWVSMDWPRVPTLVALLSYGIGYRDYIISGVGANTYYSDEEELAFLAKLGRYGVGVFGFVYGNPIYPGTRAPQDVSSDLDSYISAMLSKSPDEFREEWNHCPLVMEKYEILYRVITEELGIEL